MPCYSVRNALVCTRGTPAQRCVVCRTTRDLKLCDGPHPTKRDPKRTCDAPVCRHHALHVDPDWDFCPRCARLPEVLSRHGMGEELSNLSAAQPPVANQNPRAPEGR
jgi:hypothetical protein